ncbi:MAG: T9SS type A sorting domain-containing protein [Bacteroidota bacterium]|nr:T9SS type A sorting domain-containing protein [Bacteroidota bacterium]
MKRLFTMYLICLFACCSTLAQAQISIARADMPGNKDKAIYTNISDKIDETKTGQNYSWDFSSVTDVSQDSIVAQSPGSINIAYNLVFFGASGEKANSPIPLINDYYNFYRASNSEYAKVGSAFTVPFIGANITLTYGNSDRIYKLPLTWGNSKDSIRFSGKSTTNALFPYNSQGYRVTTVDGWGKVKLNYKTYDCIRVKSVVVQTDSIAGAPVNYSRTEYKWLAKGIKYPVFEVIVGANGSIINRTVHYFDEKTKNIYNPNGPKINFSVKDSVIFIGDTLTISNSTSGLNTWMWSVSGPGTASFVATTNNTSRNPKLSFSKEGTYTVTLKATTLIGGLINTKPRTNWIVVKPVTKPVCNFSANRTTHNLNGTINLIDESTNRPRSWNWIISPIDGVEFEAGTSASNQSPLVKFTKAGLYSVKLEVANGGGGAFALKVNYINIDGNTGINNTTLFAKTKVYPNPANDVLVLELPTVQGINCKLYNVMGQAIPIQVPTTISSSYSISTSHLPSGAYWLQISIGNEQFTSKVIISR